MNPVLAGDVADTLAAYERCYGSPSGRIDLLRAALGAGRSVISRKDVPIHVTCGAIVRNADGWVLQIRHKTFDRWLFPGGHLEPSDPSLVAAARREIAEETGLVAIEDGDAEVRPVPVDIGVHHIPVNDHKGEREHYHADFRYLLQVAEGPIRLQVDEVIDWRWADPSASDVPHLADRLRSL